MRIRRALQYLKSVNDLYKDVEFNEEWVNQLAKESSPDVAEHDNEPTDAAATDINEDELLHDRQQHCMFQDSCLMPVDNGQEILDQHLNSTFKFSCILVNE